MAMRALPLVWIVGLALGAIWRAVPARAQQGLPPQDPILRIDPGMHTATIRRIGVDNACTLLATGSHDKTVRLWRLPEGKLVRTLRPPIGPGNDGKVFAVAMAPDASWVAAGGWDAAWTASRQILSTSSTPPQAPCSPRLGPSDNVINHLTVSPDGRYLAAILHSRLRRARVGEDRCRCELAPGAGGQGLRPRAGQRRAFDRAGKLYTVADDGKLRRYAAGFRRTRPTSAPTRAGKQPFSVAVHPSGDSVAVGYTDTTAVEVYDAATLNFRFAAETSRRDQRQPGVGGLVGRRDAPLRRRSVLSDGFDPHLLLGPERPRPHATSAARDDTVLHLLPCGNGIAVGAADPAFALLDSRRQAPDLAGAGAARLQGPARREGLRRVGRRPPRPLRTGSMGRPPRSCSTWRPSSSGTLRTGRAIWSARTRQASTSPTGSTISIRSWTARPSRWSASSESRSLAIAPGAQQFVLGADWSLRSFDRTGKQLWQEGGARHDLERQHHRRRQAGRRRATATAPSAGIA